MLLNGLVHYLRSPTLTASDSDTLWTSEPSPQWTTSISFSTMNQSITLQEGNKWSLLLASRAFITLFDGQDWKRAAADSLVLQSILHPAVRWQQGELQPLSLPSAEPHLVYLQDSTLPARQVVDGLSSAWRDGLPGRQWGRGHQWGRQWALPSLRSW